MIASIIFIRKDSLLKIKEINTLVFNWLKINHDLRVDMF